MGAWGMAAFANDYALDDAHLLCSEDGVRAALEKVRPFAESGDASAANSSLDWELFTAHGAAEVVAAAHADSPYYQAEGTTLFPEAARKEGVEIEIVEYVPEEIASWLETARPRFKAADIELAISVCELLQSPEFTEDWSDPAERRDALEATKTRLKTALGTL